MGEHRTFKIGLIVVSAVLAASLIVNIYFSTQQYGITTPNIELESQLTTLQSQLDSLETTNQDYVDTHSHSNSDYDSLQNQVNNLTENVTQDSQIQSLQQQISNLNQSYLEIIEEYEDLLFQYNLLNSPESAFTTFEDLQITFSVHRTTYHYQDPISGNVSITYLNGTAFKGQFGIGIYAEFGGYGGIEMGTRYYVDGYGEFLVEPPLSFNYGPGIYTVYLGSIENLDCYTVAGGNEFDRPRVQVEAK